ncbi:DNA polymerase III subunit epsilon [Acuticoccus sediminis]|uniref:DNA-directed DNA polymerase n=1 Tax=Acuticoccus sediminis TaxID=2184697 RepID=A0A8B2NPU7_9HYPH|nr:exonuclease domain-containing protein [Acuticoccus sediminis]RAH97803.1 DNA polymerase III subunit epsilon [Acuticoccus sediminis]
MTSGPRLSLRLRMALLFAALAGVSLLSVGLGGVLAVREGVAPAALIGPAAVAAFGILVSSALIALLFDENVARPIGALAAALRAHAHGRLSVPLKVSSARYLADLAPAAAALCERLSTAHQGAAERLAEATAELKAEKARLSEILSEIPIAVMAVDHNHRITLYDRQTVHALGGVASLGLGRSVFRYFEETALRTAVETLKAQAGAPLQIDLPTADGAGTLPARLRLTGRGGGYIISMDVEPEVVAERPLVFDFALIDCTVQGVDPSIALSALPYVVFDTETTGLDPKRDSLVQIGAVRVLNGRMLEGEAFETLVNPCRPIPASATRVHGITAEMVASAPEPAPAVAAFHRFARAETLVAHNAPFDLAILARHADGIAFDEPVLDTVLLSAALFGAAEAHTLDAIAERLGVTIDAAARHTAMGDAVATAQVLLHMIPMLEAAGIRTLGDAQAAMRRHQRLMPQAGTLFAPPQRP